MSTIIHKLVFFLVSALLISGISGCGEKKPVAPKPVAQAPKPASPEPAAQQKEEPKVEKEVYVYDAKGRRDPFLSLIVVAKEKPQRKKLNPVENYDVDEIRLIAIAWDSQQHYAMITLPDNKSYTIKKGMTLGLYGGKVEKITKDYVLIQEQVKDYKGQMKTKDTILKLRKEGEE
ncbi:MAG: pilus assembly protein PilP [Nitrospirae bacterium]|nr:pilus assembly protein PilP [Nitrospirota bacterium]